MIEQLKPGDMSPVLRTSRGYQILKLESATATETMPFEKAREVIGQRVFTGKRTAEFEKYKQTLRQLAIIEWKNDDLQKAYEMGLKQTGAAPL